MSRPVPDPAVVKSMADQCIKALDGVILRFSTQPASALLFDAAGVERLINGLNRPEAGNKVASWDHAAQRYLALVPLNQARGRLDSRRQTEQKALSDELHNLLGRLSFPTGYDSPRGSIPDGCRWGAEPPWRNPEHRSGVLLAESRGCLTPALD